MLEHCRYPNVQVPPPPPGPGYHKWKDGLYKLHSDFVTWEKANATCIAEGAHLLVLDSKEEAAHAQDVIDRFLNSSSFFHVGFHDKHKEANYVTVFGKPLANTGFHQWCPGEPSGGSPEGLEHCGSIKTINNAVCLNDITCNVFEAPFFCEY
ncbi:Hemolymph lipopolysaccharide-binding protein [Gryllus bimaculatus]|nr:Hemolymph lipopolysaccharide-binding protein [Gryllus bimaculatus]